MDLKLVGCVVLLISCVCAQYSIPEVKIEALKPKGVRISLPDPDKKLSGFVFQGNVNRKIDNNGVGRISAEVIKPANGKWMYEDLNVELKVGDVINYYVFVSSDRKGYVKDNLSFRVTELIDTVAPSSKCDQSGDCGKVLLEDNFDTLREDLWTIQQYIPEEPDYPFVSYQRDSITVEDGYLKITPHLQESRPGFSEDSIMSGTLDLTKGCTSRSAYSSRCSTTGWGASILPPVVSGRVTSKVSFKYGRVEVRAKMPIGDWLYPDIVLEPLLYKYGLEQYSSGVVRIAGARGNSDLLVNGEQLGYTVLYGGPIMDFKCRQRLLRTKTSNEPWSSAFHNYTLRWEPERIVLSVDGEEWWRVEADGLQNLFGSSCELPRELLRTGSKIAPFDEHFYLSLGLSAGGITEFEDGSLKPWTNSGRKAALNFWRSKDDWLPTWRQDLYIDYVKIVAL